MGKTRKNRTVLAQAGLEFLIATGLLMILLSFAVIVYSMGLNENSMLEKGLTAQRICERVAVAISSGSASGTGFEQAVELQGTINGEDYEVFVLANSSMVIVKTMNNTNGAGHEYSTVSANCKIPTANVTNSSGHDFFNIGKKFRIRNIDGGVVVE